MLSAIEPLLTDPDRYKQRAGAEMLCGILRGMFVSCFRYRHTEDVSGSKHWPRQHYEALWTWTMSQIEVIYSQLKPDTLPFWEEVIHVSTFVWIAVLGLTGRYRSNSRKETRVVLSLLYNGL